MPTPCRTGRHGGGAPSPPGKASPSPSLHTAANRHGPFPLLPAANVLHDAQVKELPQLLMPFAHVRAPLRNTPTAGDPASTARTTVAAMPQTGGVPYQGGRGTIPAVGANCQMLRSVLSRGRSLAGLAAPRVTRTTVRGASDVAKTFKDHFAPGAARCVSSAAL